MAEGALRVYLDLLPPPSDANYVRDPQIGYRLCHHPSGGKSPPDHRANRLGFRDREPTTPKPAGVVRIVGIGDSFVYGEVAQAENFLRVMEDSLNGPRMDAGEPRFEVVMLGLGGYGPEQYLAVLRSVALDLDPDLILICFYVGNDVTGIHTRQVVRRGELYPAGSANHMLDLLRRSRLCAYLERRILFRERRAQLREDRSDLAIPAAPLRPFYLRVLRSRRPLFLDRARTEVLELWQAAEDALDAINGTCRQAGVPWGLLLIPDEIQVDPAVRAEAVRRLRWETPALDFDAPQRRLVAWGELRGVPVLDLLPDLRDGHRVERRYLANNTHWNRAGNRLAGDRLARFVRACWPQWRP